MARVVSESEIANFQELANEQLKSATTSPTFLATGFRAITAETIEYSKKSLENGTAYVEKLLGAKSFRSAIHVRSEYAKTSYAELVAYLTKIGELNTKFAKEAFSRCLTMEWFSANSPPPPMANELPSKHRRTITGLNS